MALTWRPRGLGRGEVQAEKGGVRGSERACWALVRGERRA